MLNRALCLVAIATSLAVPPLFGAAAAPRPSVAAAALGPASRRAPLAVLRKTGGRISADGLTSTVVVKFREGVDARLAGGKLAAEGRAAEAIAEGALPGGVRPTFDRPTEALRAEEARLEAESGVDLADLSLFFDVRAASPEAAERLARELETYDEIECAYVRPAPLPPEPAPASPRRVAAPPTPDFTGTQFYLQAAPGGFGILPSRGLPGGRGEGVRVVDIEYSWNLDHEDMPFDDVRRPFLSERGVDPVPEDHGNHGTAALGMLVAADNGFGVTGICPDVEVGVINPVEASGTYRLANAIDHAADVLSAGGRRGDVIQIEQQARGISKEIAALPAEWDPAVFRAIQRAVALGVVVVEPAGNGGINKKGKGRGVSLDRSELGGVFDRNNQDSGAIVVGGAEPVSATATSTSNYGSRVDVQGYGLYVTTLGYGDLSGDGDPRTAYTAVFAGTSSATPCVTGVAIIVQAGLRARGLKELDSFLMRAVLAGTGSPDGSIRTRRLGPRPNAFGALNGVDDPAVPLITSLTYAKKRDELTVDGVYFHSDVEAGSAPSVVYVNGVAAETHYLAGFPGPYGTTTRLVAVGVGAMLPSGEISYIEVGDATGPLSPRRIYVRK
jgi:hypothetical protein